MSSASSRPMPRPEPVMTATLPSSNIGEPPSAVGSLRGIEDTCPSARRLVKASSTRRHACAMGVGVRLALRLANVAVALVTLASALAVLASDIAVPGYREHYRDALWFVA